MYICNYCNRNFKIKHEICPACGGNSFTEKAYLGEIVIKTPPKDGYKINEANFIEANKKNKSFLTIGIIIIIVAFIFELPFTLIGLLFLIFDNSFSIDTLALFIPTLIPLLILLFIIKVYNKRKKELKKEQNRVLQLAKYGMLVQNIPYEIINYGTSINGKIKSYYLKVNYENTNGTKIPLKSDLKYNYNEQLKYDNTVDLLIDPNDYSNYYIDYEIY